MNHPTTKVVTFKGDKDYTLDQYGFLDPPEQWDEEFANGMARLQGIYDGLTKEHWDFISYIREKYLTERKLPLLVAACAEKHLRLSKLKSLFPTGYFRGACRIAGLNYKFMNEVNTWAICETATLLMCEFKVTPQGFLEDFNQWNERFANLVSCEWKLPNGLTYKHWEIIRFLRNYYLTMNNIPTVYEVCQAHKIDIEDLYELFPEGYRRGACRIAGLPFFT
jgi:tRNA 2-thiouridine synthesizing protein E